MFAERGAQNTDEVRASLRVIPGLLRVWGGDGEREQEQQDPPEEEQVEENNQQDPPEQEEEDKTKSKELSAEDQLDEERKKRIQAEKKLAKAEAEKEKSKGDVDAAKERDKYKSENDKLRQFMDDNLLAWSIAQNKKYVWENEDDVLKFIDLEAISIDLEAKTVDGLDLQLKRIAKDKPYLLQKKKEEQEGDGEPGVPSGSHPRGGKTDESATENKRLGEKYRIPGFGTQGAQRIM